MQENAPVVELAVQAEPVSVHVPVELLESDIDEATAYEICTDAPTGADPVSVSVRVVVMSSDVIEPLSEAVARSGTLAAGKTYRMTTMPEPPLPAVPFTSPVTFAEQ